MKFLTLDEIKEAANKSDLAALQCSLRHWQENVWRLEHGLEPLTGTLWCACCLRASYVSSIRCPWPGGKFCPLNEIAALCCGGRYHKFKSNPTVENAQAVVDYIGRAIDEYVLETSKKLVAGVKTGRVLILQREWRVGFAEATRILEIIDGLN